MMAPHDKPQLGVKQEQRNRRADGGDGDGGGEHKGGGPAVTEMLQLLQSDTAADLKIPKIHKTNNITEECMRRPGRGHKGAAGVQRRQQHQEQQLSHNDRKTLKVRDSSAPAPSFGRMLVRQAKKAAGRSNIFDFFTRLQQSFAESQPQQGGHSTVSKPPRKTRQSLAPHCRRPGRRPHNERSSSNPSSKSIALPHWGGRLAVPWYPIIAVTLLLVAVSLPDGTRGDDGDNFFAVNSFNVIPETTTQEFDYASRGQKKFGDKCDNTLECGFPGSICDSKKKSCQCTEDLPVTNHIDKCGKEAAVNESCFFNEQCEVKYFQTECRDNRCVCRFEMSPVWGKDGSVECKGRQDKKGNDTYLDPAMIGVLVGMALMFIIICVVLRLFSQARWRDNRTIFNTPNPRLMNVSLLRDSKLLHGQERRGSRMSVRGPSRQPSMVSLRPHSPNPSLGKPGSRTGSHGSNVSSGSVRSGRSNSVAPGHIQHGNNHHQQHERSAHPHPHKEGHHADAAHHHHQPDANGSHPHHQNQPASPHKPNITSNPVAESVTVEIIEPDH